MINRFKKIRLPLLVAFAFSALLLSACVSIPLLGIKFTTINGAKVLESKDEYQGKPVVFYVFYFDTFQGSFSQDVQVTMHMANLENMPRHRLVMTSNARKAVTRASIKVNADGKDFVLPLSTYDEEKERFIQRDWGSKTEYVKVEVDQMASYIITDDVRAALLGASKIAIQVKKKMREINEKDMVSFKALLAVDTFVPDKPIK